MFDKTGRPVFRYLIRSNPLISAVARRNIVHLWQHHAVYPLSTILFKCTLLQGDFYVRTPCPISKREDYPRFSLRGVTERRDVPYDVPTCWRTTVMRGGKSTAPLIERDGTPPSSGSVFLGYVLSLPGWDEAASD